MRKLWHREIRQLAKVTQLPSVDLNPVVQPWSLGSYSYTALQPTCRDTGTLCAELSPPQDDRETDHVGSYNTLALSLSGALGLGSISLTFLQGCFLLTLLRPSLSPLSKGEPLPRMSHYLFPPKLITLGLSWLCFICSLGHSLSLFSPD